VSTSYRGPGHEQALDDNQRHTFVRHLNRVRVPQLMGREPSTHASGRRRPAQLGARRGG
jgi:hypothetical protein